MLRPLIGCWILQSAAAIEFYARRYEYAGIPLLPHGALAALALATLFLPALPRAWPQARREAARTAAFALVCATALLLAVQYPFQFLHVAIVLVLLSGLLASTGLALAAPVPAWAARLMLALPLASLNFLLLAYYAILVIGRETWNQVVSRELLWTYFWQLPELVAAMPVPAWVPVAAALGLFLALFAVYWAAAPSIARGLAAGRARLHTQALARGAAGRARAAALIIVAAVAALSGEWVFRNAAYGDTPDPLVTTFFVTQDEPGTSTMPFAPDPRLLARDREVAARYAAPASFTPKTLVLITVDALRADQMQVYGHPRQNTPFLSSLYREGRLARIDNAFSICTESLCGLLAVHASRHWHELGTRNFSLPDALKRLGYRNHFLLGGDHANFYGLRSYYGVNIDEYFDGSMAAGYMNDDTAVLERLARLDASQPVPRFIYLHLMSVHMLGKRMPQYQVWYRKAAGAQRGAGCCDTKAEYANKYHDGILQTDALIERIFRILEDKGLLGNAVVVITGDHGEMLGEGGQVGHGGVPLDPAVRVPLLIFDTERFAYPPHALASIIDIAPTLLDRIGAPIPEHWTGVPLSRPAGRRYAIMQSRRVYAIVGESQGSLYKYYRYPDREQQVRLLPGGGEQLLDAEGSRAAVFADLRLELERQIPALRRESPTAPVHNAER